MAERVGSTVSFMFLKLFVEWSGVNIVRPAHCVKDDQDLLGRPGSATTGAWEGSPWNLPDVEHAMITKVLLSLQIRQKDLVLWTITVFSLQFTEASFGWLLPVSCRPPSRNREHLNCSTTLSLLRTPLNSLAAHQGSGSGGLLEIVWKGRPQCWLPMAWALL